MHYVSSSLRYITINFKINYHVIAIDLGSDYKQKRGEESKEEATQRQREITVFQPIYVNPSQIPQNPLRELDELYAKDEKIFQVDCEQNSNDYFKKKDDERFQQELQLLTQELQQLDEGKSWATGLNILFIIWANTWIQFKTVVYLSRIICIRQKPHHHTMLLCWLSFEQLGFVSQDVNCFTYSY